MSTPQLVPLPGAGLMGLGGGVLRTRTVAPAPSPKPAPRAQVHHPARIEALPALPDGAATARKPPETYDRALGVAQRMGDAA